MSNILNFTCCCNFGITGSIGSIADRVCSSSFNTKYMNTGMPLMSLLGSAPRDSNSLYISAVVACNSGESS